MEPEHTPGNLPAAFLPPLGGAANIVSASRRGSRLSVSVKDQSLADPDALAELPGVAGCTMQNGRVRIELTEQTHQTVKENRLMPSKYDGLARIIIQNVGGKSNINSGPTASPACASSSRMNPRPTRKSWKPPTA